MSEKQISSTENVVGVASLVLLASSIAREAHAGQFRRDGVTPYITHPEAVAESLAGEHPDIIAAAWLHDVLEDTEVTISELKRAGIPWRVMDAVLMLTRGDGQSYEDYLRWITQDEIALKVKIADIGHNLSDAPTEKQVAKYQIALGLLANVKEHATLSAGASVDHGVEVESTGEHVNRAADRGCCVSTCCASLFEEGRVVVEWAVGGSDHRVITARRSHAMTRMIDCCRWSADIRFGSSLSKPSSEAGENTQLLFTWDRQSCGPVSQV